MKKRFAIPEKWIELMFGVGASIVIIGALMKITHSDLGPISGNDMLTVGLITEAIIFLISGLRGYYFAQDNDIVDASTPAGKTAEVDAEAKALKQAFVDAKEQIGALSSNLKSATSATASISFPKDFQANIETLNNNMASAGNSVAQIDASYKKVQSSLDGHPTSNEALLQSSIQLQTQLEQMNQRVAELNTKYAALVEAMRK